MPTYQYACTACGHRFEAVQSFSDASLTDCPECAGRLRKVFSSVGIVFKGSGFYRTDSRAGASDGPVKEKVSADRRRRAAPATPRVPPRPTRREKSDSGSSSTSSRPRPRRRPAAHPPRPRLPDARPGGCPHRRRLSTGSPDTARRTARRPSVDSDDKGTTMVREPPHRRPPRRPARVLATLRTPGWRRTLLLRRTAALLLAALALALALRPADATSRSAVVVAARDLPSGTALTPADLTLASWPGDIVPVGVLRAPADAVAACSPGPPGPASRSRTCG